MIKIASFGCGVDSVAGLLLNSDYDEIIFADTGSERPETYTYLDYFEKKSGLTITKVKSHVGNIYDYFVKGKSQPSKYHHFCSDKFKIAPIRKYLRTKYGKKETFEMNIFIDYQESHRSRTSNVKYITNKYPLVERKLNRERLKEIIQEHDYILPIKSGCYFCCFTTKSGWQDLKNKQPKLFDKALTLEKNSNTTTQLINMRGKDSQTLFECKCFNG